MKGREKDGCADPRRIIPLTGIEKRKAIPDRK
jgi:hypothetical protein